METVATAALCWGILAMLTLVLVRFQRSLDEPGGRRVRRPVEPGD